MKNNIKASIIISTYNKPRWLELVLWSYHFQTVQDFEVIIADDGSTQETKKLVESFSKLTTFQIIHVWQEDNGFQKTKILNKAILASRSLYLIFTDGDCIARNDFVATHLKFRKPCLALSGGYFKMEETVSEKVNKAIIENQLCFNLKWLREQGQSFSIKPNKLTKLKGFASFMNNITPTKATFNGMNTSCWKKDILDVNGFDERMQYGGEDREVGERMMHNGVEFKQIRYSAICVHLHHDRPYKNKEAIEINKEIREIVKKEKNKWTEFGIENLK